MSPRLITLGRLTLVAESSEVDDLAKRRRKLALLAVLALSPRPLSRDRLVDMFWGEEPEERARHSLSDALSHLRRVLGRDAIATRQTEISLADATALEVDAREFAHACDAHDWEHAVA